MFIEILGKKQLSTEELKWVDDIAAYNGGEWEYVVVTSARATQSVWSGLQPGVDVAELDRENVSEPTLIGLDNLIIPNLDSWYKLHFRGEISSVGIHYRGHIR